MNILEIESNYSKDITTNLVIDVLKKDKQCIVFVSSKRAAESQAEKIAKALKKIKFNQINEIIENISEKSLKALSKPTKQCIRLSFCLKEGISFHHSGLHPKQREIVENEFRNKNIKVICATPTLAQGLDLPAYRVIIRDYKRYGSKGMVPIPVLEYEQQSGRAGRPGMEDFGESILISNGEDEFDFLKEKYINGEPENIISKLAVEPVLRTYILSLVSSGFIKDRNELYDFFSKTFYAKNFGNISKLKQTLERMVDKLEKWNFIKTNKIKNEKIEDNFGFTSASSLNLSKQNYKIEATKIGSRISQLYLDPYTANFMIKSLKSMKNSDLFGDVGILSILVKCIEIRPLLNIKSKEEDLFEQVYVKYEDELLFSEKNLAKLSEFENDELDNLFISLEEIKTISFLKKWMDETSEDKLMEMYGIRPGEINYKINIADWLTYSLIELVKHIGLNRFIRPIHRFRIRLKSGIKEELLTLIQLKGVGRARARKLFNLGIKDLGDIKKCDINILSRTVGKNLAIKLKEQVGIKINLDNIIKTKNNKKIKKQFCLNDF